MSDKFRNRVMFPIIDLRGNVIGFGGRIMGQAKEINGFKIPKYLNSPKPRYLIREETCFL